MPFHFYNCIPTVNTALCRRYCLWQIRNYLNPSSYADLHTRETTAPSRVCCPLQEFGFNACSSGNLYLMIFTEKNNVWTEMTWAHLHPKKTGKSSPIPSIPWWKQKIVTPLFLQNAYYCQMPSQRESRIIPLSLVTVYVGKIELNLALSVCVAAEVTRE